jgi:hypothetical protein
MAPSKDAPTTNGSSALESVTNGPVSKAVKDQSLSHYHSLFSSLISWENPRVSAIAYASIVTSIVAVRYLDLLRYSFKLTYLLLGVTIAAEVGGKATMGTGLATSFRPRKYITLSKDALEAMIGDAHELLNFFMIEAQRIAFVENVWASIGAFVASFISYYLVKVVPYWGLALIATTALFFAPLIYSSNQELIDAQLKNASEVVNAQTAQLKEVAGKHTAQYTELAKQHMGDYTAKAQAMLHGRASSPTATTKTPGKDIKDTDFPAAPSTEPTKARKGEEEAIPAM